MIRKTVWFNSEIVRKLNNICKRDGLRFSDLIRRAVAEFLRREEKNGD